MAYVRTGGMSTAARRRRRRTALVLTGLTLMLAVVLVYAVAYYQGWLGGEDSAADADQVTATAPPLRPGDVRVNVYNANGEPGLAGRTSEELESRGFVVDAVDNVTARLDLAEVCQSLQVPLVHGAIAGWYGHVATILPGDPTMQTIYRHWQGGKGVEQQLGNPSFTPAVAASLEVAEVCKLLLDQGRLLRNRKLAFNLLHMEVDEIPL